MVVWPQNQTRCDSPPPNDDKAYTANRAQTHSFKISRRGSLLNDNGDPGNEEKYGP